MMRVEKRFLRVPEVATYLGLSTGAIRKWVRLGTIPFRKINGAIRFDIEAIDQWVERQDRNKNPYKNHEEFLLKATPKGLQ